MALLQRMIQNTRYRLVVFPGPGVRQPWCPLLPRLPQCSHGEKNLHHMTSSRTTLSNRDHYCVPQSASLFTRAFNLFDKLVNYTVFRCYNGGSPPRGGIRGNNMYKPNVQKRIKKHGLAKRCSSISQLRILWRRKLRGRHNLHT